MSSKEWLTTEEDTKKYILSHLDNARDLEQLYHQNTGSFIRVMDSLYQDQPAQPMLKFWHERIHYQEDTGGKEKTMEAFFFLLAVLFAGFIAKIPDLFNIDEEFFYSRNISFIVFPFLACFFIMRQKIQVGLIALVSIIFILAGIYMNLLPNDPNSDPLVLANLHLPLFIWSMVALAFLGDAWRDTGKRLSFLQYNGDLVVVSAILALAGGITAAISFNLFDLIGVNLEEFYSSYLMYWAIPAVPLIGTWLVFSQPGLVSKISPMVARVFTPLVLFMLVIYLISMVVTGKDPYHDRDFLIMFNLMLVGVMALIVFSVVSHRQETSPVYARFILPGLCLVASIVNGIALTAILFRISEYGLTPNRLAVLGSNILMMIHVGIVTYRFFMELIHPSGLDSVRRSLAVFLPVYTIWAGFVVVVFPWLFR